MSADAAGAGKEEEEDGAKAEEGWQEGQGQEAEGLGGWRRQRVTGRPSYDANGGHEQGGALGWESVPL